MHCPIEQFRLRRFEYPRGRVIGDCQIRVPSTNWLGTVELVDAAGHIGLGFFASMREPLPSALELHVYYKRDLWPSINGMTPEALINRVSHPRGGQVRAFAYDLADATKEALWDLAAKRAGLPLFRYLGGTDPRVLAYASGLCFHLSDEDTHVFYREARAAGYRAAKVKVGHPDPFWDLARLRLVADAMGQSARLMIDANEAWSPREAAARLALFADNGLAIHWVEDPLPRDDFTGLRWLRGASRGALINSGEYLTPELRVALLAADAVDIVNLNGTIGDNLRLARACIAANRPMTIGNSVMNVNAHLAAALPDIDMAEDSQLDWTEILAEPLPVIDGAFLLSDRPGHGLSISDDADARCGGSRA